MSRLIWDAIGEKFYEMGTKMGALYPMKEDGSYENGVAWNGLTAVTESPSGAEETKLYADDIKYASLRSAEEYAYGETGTACSFYWCDDRCIRRTSRRSCSYDHHHKECEEPEVHSIVYWNDCSVCRRAGLGRSAEGNLDHRK